MSKEVPIAKPIGYGVMVEYSPIDEAIRIYLDHKDKVHTTVDVNNSVTLHVDENDIPIIIEIYECGEYVEQVQRSRMMEAT